MNIDKCTWIFGLVVCVFAVGCKPNAREDATEDTSPEAHAVVEVTDEASTSSASSETTNTDAVTITVHISKFRNSDGVVQLTLFDKEEDFMKAGSKSAQILRVGIETENATCEFPDIDPGQYAIVLMHDEDEDGEISLNAIRIPKEGIGTSRNAKMRFGPPKWEDAVFTVGRDDITLEIEMKYLGL